MSPFIQIGNQLVGAGYPVYVVAEISANHSQDFDLAARLVREAKSAGADAVKLQTYTPDTLTIQSNREHFQIGGGTLWDGKTLYDLYQEAFTPWEWQPKLKKIADKIGIDLFSSAFNPSAVDFLEKMDVPVHKVASFELVDIPLIEKMAQTGKPIIMSTGMATFEEIEEAVKAARQSGATQIALLKCTSAYPAPAEEMNLRTIPELASRFKIPVGLSDHTLGMTVPIAAVALGACIIEKHFTLSRQKPGPDSSFSLEPHEFKAMADAVRQIEKAMGEPSFGPTASEAKSAIFRRSLFVVRPIKRGETFTEQNIRSIRPSGGLQPKYLNRVVGKKAKRDLAASEPLSWDDVSDTQSTEHDDSRI